MFGFGSFSHLVLVLVLALILLGPKQLPEVARTLGRLLQDLRRMSNMLTDEFRQQMYEEERQRNIQPPTPGAPVVPQNPNVPEHISSAPPAEPVPYQPYSQRTHPLSGGYGHSQEASSEIENHPVTSTEQSAHSSQAPTSINDAPVAAGESKTEEKKS